MKGSLAAMIAAVSRIQRSEQTAPIRIVCTADEEIGFLGVKHLVKNADAFRQIVREQPLAIIGEPTRCRVVHAHKGYAAIRFISHGRAAHSSSRQGINATLTMVPMLNRLMELHRRAESDPALMDPRFDPPTMAWNFGVSDHCSTTNITPARCEAWLSWRAMPSVDGTALLAEVEAEARRLGLEVSRDPGSGVLWVEPDHPAVITMCELAGESPAATVGYATDGGELGELRNRLVCGPGDIAQAHTSDEWIEVDQLQRGVDLYFRALKHWCTCM